jgi:hypothetical protein
MLARFMEKRSPQGCVHPLYRSEREREREREREGEREKERDRESVFIFKRNDGRLGTF